MRRISATAVLVGCAVALAGCAGETSGSPAQPGTPDGKPMSAASPSSSVPPGVPEVTDPVDTTAFERGPCSVLTERQLEKLAIPTEPEIDSDSPGGPSCVWDAFDESGLHLDGAFITAGSSLAGSYKKADQGGYENFVPVTIAGYPGFLTWSDTLEKGLCSVSVGVRNDLLYVLTGRVAQDSPYFGDPCPVVKKAATMAIETMTQGGS